MRKLFRKELLKKSISPRQEIHSKWIGANKTPFGVELLDCSEFCQKMISTARDQAVVEKYMALRSSDGSEYRGKFPQNPVTIGCDLTYPYQDEPQEGTLYKAQVMEDKWDIYLYGLCIYFVRSWTGNLVYMGRVVFEPGLARLHAVIASAEGSGSDGYSVAAVDYLIKSHLYRLATPHPLPPNYPRDVTQITLFSFSQFGRFARFATFADVTRFRV